MKKILFLIQFIFVISMTIMCNRDNDTFSKNNDILEEKVSSYQIISEGNTSKGGCRMTVNYYYQGEYVGQQTYTGGSCRIAGIYTCADWKEVMLNYINEHIADEGTMLPGGDFTC